jgi:diaminopimelate epimerase
LRLSRAHGLGNDYLVLEAGPVLEPGIVRAVCDRHRGFGADGLLEPIATVDADYGVRIWNPDGSVAEKSGNGLRIFARWLVDVRGAPAAFSVWTGFDAVRCEVGPVDVAVDMGRATFDPARVPVLADAPVLGEAWDVGGDALPIVAVGMGNPHCVVFTQGDLDLLPWRRWGALLEVHSAFPRRTNVQFARVLDRRRVEIRIWERGAGETQASGSSSCAVAAAGVQTGRLDPGRVEVSMPGGVLRVTVGADRAVRLEGPVEVVGRVEVDPRWLASRLGGAGHTP